MRIAITGGRGRIGSAVARQALDAGHDVVSIDLGPAPNAAPGAAPQAAPDSQLVQRLADCSDYDALHRALDGCDALVHLAAIPAPGNDPDHVVHNRNVTASYNALRAAADRGIRRICQASSVNAIGLAFGKRSRFDYFPLDEAHPNYGEDPYSLSKWICEQQADNIVRSFDGTRIASLRFHYTVPDRAIAEQNYVPKSDEAEKHLWGYTLLDPAARACLLSLEDGFAGHEVFYIAAPDTVHHRPSLDLAAEYFPRVPVTGDLGGRNSFFSSDKARRVLGWVHPAHDPDQ
ncbi:MAG: NAD(P)-dependent oxidoreductase [Rhodobacteraceae bacterium]|nr:NAD(P)-dependent oxidoreductase [Paracoccaceae bacterium]